MSVDDIYVVNGRSYHVDWGVSATVTCEMLGKSSVRDEVLVFVQRPFNNTLTTTSETNLTDFKLIPCPTNDPTEPVSLFRMNETVDWKEVTSSTIHYDPTEGFKSEDVFDGVYNCRQDKYSATFNALSTISDEYQFLPKSEFVVVFDEESIDFECYSKSGLPVEIDASTNKTVNATYITTENRTIVKLNCLSIDDEEAICGYGNVTCTTDTSGDNVDSTTVKKWSYILIKTPKLYLEIKNSALRCSFPINESMELVSVSCVDINDCNHKRRCLSNMTKCSLGIYKTFSSSNTFECYGEKENTMQFCTDVDTPIKHEMMHAVAMCTVAGLSKQVQYFRSLDLKPYFNWKDVPVHELIRLLPVPPTLYANGTTKFTCEGSNYLFSEWLLFELELRNGSRLKLVDNNSTVKILPGRGVPNLVVTFIVTLHLPIDSVGIYCIGQFLNSPEVIVSYKQFETMYMREPYFPEICSEDLMQETFYTGQKFQRLSCTAEGGPHPEYTWLFNNSLVQSIRPGIEQSIRDTASVLEFPVIEDKDRTKYEGEYKCVAINELGKAEKKFYVKISDKGIGTAFIYILSTGLVFLLAIGIVVHVIFLRRYKKTKALLPNLTDYEVEEYFHGRPNIVRNSYSTSFETVEFQPFKKEYEIPFEDLEFDSSDKNLLGSGAYSFVVRGKIKSKDAPVALKISKPSTDVVLFKSLLSEVKIMLYIGEHENIMSLVGVCTASIKTRSIYIATDICELGSLNVYLRKSRPLFVDLMGTSDQVDLTMMPQNTSESEKLTTLDLISFCFQIAKGMEYLSFKSVIHGDLATRNVLITGQKIAKISDFGLSKKLYESTNYVKKSQAPLPWRWMAIESLKTLTFSTSSDVWSYGDTLYEIFTLGDAPFPNKSWSADFMARLESGMRMGRPEYCTHDIYSKISKCWEKNPEVRPNFTDLRKFFETMCEDNGLN